MRKKALSQYLSKYRTDGQSADPPSTLIHPFFFASMTSPRPECVISVSGLFLYFNGLWFGLKKSHVHPYSSFLFCISDFILPRFCSANSTQTCIWKVESPFIILWHFLWDPRLMWIMWNTHKIQKPMQVPRRAFEKYGIYSLYYGSFYGTQG